MWIPYLLLAFLRSAHALLNLVHYTPSLDYLRPIIQLSCFALMAVNNVTCSFLLQEYHNLIKKKHNINPTNHSTSLAFQKPLDIFCTTSLVFPKSLDIFYTKSRAIFSTAPYPHISKPILPPPRPSLKQR